MSQIEQKTDGPDLAETSEKLGAPEERKWPVQPEFTPEMLAEMEKTLPCQAQQNSSDFSRGMRPLWDVLGRMPLQRVNTG